MREGLPVDRLRRLFPALERAGRFVFFDNAAGAQVPQTVLDAVSHHLVDRNVQRGGPYRHSREVDAMIARARESVGAFVNARSAQEIAFGLNATSFIRSISLAIGQDLASRQERREIVVSELDHEANIATWLALERFGARIVWWRVRGDGRLYSDDLQPLLSERTRLVACTVASNATGTIVDVGEVSRRAHAEGAEVFLDAVHYAPHGPIDVQAIDCDFLVCSGYKVFAPHMGFAWCRPEAIDPLPTFREEFIPNVTPDKLEAGTYVYENVAGMDAAVGYIEALGGNAPAEPTAPTTDDDPARRNVAARRNAIRLGMRRIADHERMLSGRLLDALASLDRKDRHLRVHGVTDRELLRERVPTLCFSVDGLESSAIADGLAAREVGVRSGHMYTPRLMARLGLMPGGVVRASLVHYNTVEEIECFQNALAETLVDIEGRRAN
jgi:cysteine desulfurase family protein (TIGR01976 family)